MSASRRLLAVDLDGTLLSSTRNISPADRRALAACVARGVAVAIVTGRRFPAARPFVEMLPIDPFVVANSGAIILGGADGPVVRRSLLPMAMANVVLEAAARSGMEPVLHDGPNGEGRLVLCESARELPHVGRYVNQSNPPPVWVHTMRLERDPVQIGFAGGVTAIRELATRLATELGAHEMDVTLARTEYPLEDLALLDVLASDANKATSLRFLADYLEIPMSETIAIGDNWNDLEMLETAALGIVMANAVEELRRRGFVETASNDEAGVAQAIYKHVLGGGTRRNEMRRKSEDG